MNTNPVARPANNLCVVYTSGTREQALQFAGQHGLTAFTGRTVGYELQMLFLDDRIELHDTAMGASVCVDFVSGALAHRERFGGGKGQALARAIGLNKYSKPTVIDATTGLARDAWVLATLGCRLTLVERSPVLYAMVADGIRRALVSGEANAVANFTNLVCADTGLYLDHMDADSRPDVIYLDPMYPESGKSALVKKDMQILHKLIGTGEDASSLLETALRSASRRVVVKRPAHAESLPGPAPVAAIASRKTRYDIYTVG